MKTAIIITFIVALAACAPTAMHPTTHFEPSHFAACSGTGTGQLAGQAFLRTMVGEVRYAAGGTVQLVPATPYTREIMAMNLQGIAPAAVDSRLNAYRRTTQADGEGEFEFENLPPCDYIVAIEIYWQVPYGSYLASTEGGIVAREVSVRDSQTTKVILTR